MKISSATRISFYPLASLYQLKMTASGEGLPYLSLAGSYPSLGSPSGLLQPFMQPHEDSAGKEEEVSLCSGLAS